MKTSTKVILGVGGVAVLGFVTYLALKPKNPTAPPPPKKSPTAPSQPSTGGGTDINTYVKAVTDIIGIFSKPKVEKPSVQQPTQSTTNSADTFGGNYY